MKYPIEPKKYNICKPEGFVPGKWYTCVDPKGFGGDFKEDHSYLCVKYNNKAFVVNNQGKCMAVDGLISQFKPAD